MKQIHRFYHIYHEFVFFSFYCFNSCIVLENLYKTFWSIIETFWSGRGARSVRYVIGRRKILFRSLRYDEITLLYPPTDAASQFPYIFALKEASIVKQIHRFYHIYHEFVFFSFYCFNSCIVLENLYKTFWSIIETFWSGRGARSVRYVIGRRKILFILVPNLYLSRRTSCMNILYFYHLDDFTFETAVPRWPRTAISSLVAFYFKF